MPIRSEVIILLVIVALIYWAFKFLRWSIQSIWYILTGRGEDKVINKNGKNEDWLTNAQARQNIRFENSLPPLKQKAEPLKKTFREKRNERKGKSATGWTFNEETQLWEPPKNMKR